MIVHDSPCHPDSDCKPFLACFLLLFLVAPSEPLCLLASTLLLSLPHFHSLIETFLLLEFSYDVCVSSTALLNVEHETEF